MATMSTDLKFQLPSIEFQTPHPINRRSIGEDEQDRTPTGEKSKIQTKNCPKSNGKVAEKVCVTPESDENKIPQLRSPPPAPKKEKRLPLCKRKLISEFVEVGNSDKVDEFFRSGFEVVSRLSKRTKFVST